MAIAWPWQRQTPRDTDPIRDVTDNMINAYNIRAVAHTAAQETATTANAPTLERLLEQSRLQEQQEENRAGLVRAVEQLRNDARQNVFSNTMASPSFRVIDYNHMLERLDILEAKIDKLLKLAEKPWFLQKQKPQ